MDSDSSFGFGISVGSPTLLEVKNYYRSIHLMSPNSRIVYDDSELENSFELSGSFREFLERKIKENDPKDLKTPVKKDDTDRSTFSDSEIHAGTPGIDEIKKYFGDERSQPSHKDIPEKSMSI